MNEETETRQYCVTVKLYTWAENEQDAADTVGDSLGSVTWGINGFDYPTTDDVTEDTTP